ncbi:MAG: DUF1255 family protein [Betaproteobacteria bacterium]|nr:DUF1255 family protein [Betaproteobacteria bacterium]
MDRFENVSVVKKANVYFGGRCVSHSIEFPDGTRKSVGVIFAGTLEFRTGAPEVMELNAGRCRVRLSGQSDWQEFGAGDRFEVPANSSFDIETLEMVDYVCHYGA